MVMRTSEEIAKGNDLLRTVGSKDGLPGKVIVTNAVRHSKHFDAILDAMISFNTFNEDNDPYKEHDVGIFDVYGESYMFKIDYYDPSMEEGADPHEAESFLRVLTLMVSSEY